MMSNLVKIRILGIDPGLNHTGFGVIDVVGEHVSFVTAGCIHVPKGELAERLGHIAKELGKIIEETQPALAAAEIIFLNANPKSTLLLGQARGAALTAVALKDLEVREFSATQIKRAIVGTGRASKKDIQEMMRRTLSIKVEQPDAADALACALTCAHALKVQTILSSDRNPAPGNPLTLRRSRGNRGAWEKLLKERHQG